MRRLRLANQMVSRSMFDVRRSSASLSMREVSSQSSSSRTSNASRLIDEEEGLGSSTRTVDDSEDCEDEYKQVDASGETFVAPQFFLESGKELVDVQVRYKTWGKLNETRDNCMVVCHALTGNASLDSWWGSMLGPGKLFDDSKMFIVCANILGSCYGTTGPTSRNPSREDGQVYGADFPDITVRDSVSLHMKLVKEGLGVKKVACVVGGSLGGMQTLEWACLGKDYVGAIIPMCCGAFHHPWQIGISEAQRQAIYADPNWQEGKYLNNGGPKPTGGLGVARAIAMITYRSHAGYSRKFGRHAVANALPGHGQERFFQVENYLRHQGDKFCERFDALSYVKVTRMMDTHDVGRNRPGGIPFVLSKLEQPTLIISVESDVLYPPIEQQYLHQHIPNSTLFNIQSDHGHDGFLLDQDAIMPVAIDFLNKHVYSKMGDQQQNQPPLSASSKL